MRNKFSTLTIGLLMTVLSATAQQADRSKLSPMLADMLTPTKASARGTAPAEETYVLALVKLAGNDEQVLTSHGCTVVDRIGRVRIALLPVSQLALLSLDDRVERMEANPLSRPLMDITPGAVNATPVYQGTQLPQAYTGKGVVVGICDIGLDFTNPMFMDAEGKTRIRQAWDIYTGQSTGYKGIGSLYVTPDELASARGTSDSTVYHGTHVTAIAAGSAACGGRYQGIAHEADIVMSLTYLSTYTTEQYQNLVKSLNASLKEDTADPLITDAAKKRISLSNALEALAVKHVMDYATLHGQPCVVNCSFGSQQKLTDDYSVISEVMNSLTGPGRIIVCSAGNGGDGILYRLKEARQKMDSRLWLKSSLTPTITLRSTGDFTLKLLPDIAGADTLTISSANIRSRAGEEQKDSARIDGSQLQDWLYTTSKSYDMPTGMTAYSVKMQLPTNTKAYVTPSVAIVVEGDEQVEVMGATTAATFNRLSAGSYAVNVPYTVSVPAAFDQMIAVGLTSHRDSITNLNGERKTYDYNDNALGQVVSWSGSGPTLEGRMKPDVVAPGHNIVSAFNSNCDLSNLSAKRQALLADRETIDGKTYYWKCESGSSMSAPVVTGTIALWLQANPQLTPDDVKSILAATARRPEPDEAYPNYRYGYGEIDAYRGLLYLTELMGVEGLSDHQPSQLTFRLTGCTLTLSGATRAAVTVYALGGTVVLRTLTTDGSVDLSRLQPGVYAVQVDTGDSRTSGSTLVRYEK